MGYLLLYPLKPIPCFLESTLMCKNVYTRMKKAKSVDCSSLVCIRFLYFVLSEFCSECQCESCPGKTEVSYWTLIHQVMRGSSFLSTGILSVD